MPYHIYLETSAVNYLADTFKTDELIVIKRLIEQEEDSCFCISSTTISEILSTQDEQRKENLIYCMQNICSDNLINSPSELIINYINAGMPNIEDEYNFYSKSGLANTWKDLCSCTSKTFIYDIDELKRKVKFAQKKFKQMVQDSLDENKNYGNGIEYAIRKDKNFKYFNQDEIKIRRIAWLLIFIIVCCEVDLIDNFAIKEYWNKLKLASTVDRLSFSVENLGRLTEIGPIRMMSIMWYSQIDNKHNRGTLLDMFHSIYLVYCNTFLTNDKHFMHLKDSAGHINFQKIQHISENPFFLQLKEFCHQYSKYS